MRYSIQHRCLNYLLSLRVGLGSICNKYEQLEFVGEHHLSFSDSSFYTKPALWHYYHEVPEDGNGRQRAFSAGSPCGCLDAAGGKPAMLLLYVKSPANN